MSAGVKQTPPIRTGFAESHSHHSCRASGRGPSAQAFSPPGPSRLQPQHAQQHPANYRSPVAPVTLPPPRLGPLPGGPVPGLGGRRDHPGTLADRPRYVSCLQASSIFSCCDHMMADMTCFTLLVVSPHSYPMYTSCGLCSFLPMVTGNCSSNPSGWHSMTVVYTLLTFHAS